MSGKKQTRSKSETTPVFRASYAYVFEKQSSLSGQEPKYTIQMIFDKGTDFSKLKAICKEAIAKEFGEQVPTNLRSPFREGNVDKEGKPEYKDKIFINATTKTRPGVVDKDATTLIGPEHGNAELFYSGCYARAVVVAQAYDYLGQKGVKFYLQAIQKVRDGNPLGSGVQADKAFKPVEDVETDSDTNDFLN